MNEARTIPSLLTPVLIAACAATASAHMGAKFEPADGQVLHGLGQYVPLFYTDAENWQYVADYQAAAGHPPVIYAAYKFLDPSVAPFDTTSLTDIVQNHGHPYHLNLGLALFDATQSINAAALINGEWDAQIAAVATEVKSLGVPTFCRPGFEFGTGSSGIHSGISGPDFIAVWHHIRSVFDTVGVTNVAWVWNAVNPNQFSYMVYYPGDDAVDWWGINYFTVSQMNNAEAFVLAAASHNKPVIICESCPIHNGGTDNVANWQDWFVPYFAKITTHAHLKAFTYISDPWDRPGYFDDWANSLIGPNTPATIRANYAAELSNARYVHHGTLQTLAVTEINGNWGEVIVLPEPTDANDPNALAYLPNTWVTLEAVPIDGKWFRHWQTYDPNFPGDANYAVTDSNNPITIVMNADYEATAVFKCGSGTGSALPLLTIGIAACAFFRSGGRSVGLPVKRRPGARRWRK
ncbi:MAG: hypothetical protein JXQ73_13240 [Phycisphaerae bacterium]|nr:hypothetical protein [Phycisphaerae bacterium]